ncbi:MAG: primosomal protein N' [Campylobacterota bacterium]|nr:primosomal protein N' [Campylobacterota bacterium]
MKTYIYHLTPLKLPLGVLTYHCDREILVGAVVKISLGSRLIEGVIVSQASKPDFDTLHIEEVSDFIYSKKQIEIATFIASYYFCSLGEALALLTPLQIVGIPNVDIRNEVKNSSIMLSSYQQEALEFLKQHKISLLFGDTGSGKTEIYMYYFSEVITQGKKAIFLMPEIALTPQIYNRLEEHFPSRVIHWHSKLTKKQREKNLEKLHAGDYDIIAGARSALFLNIENLGVIVVDEEHDDSYKSNSRPRYNARDLAVYIGSKLHVNVILGSATPSLSSYVKFPHYRLRGTHFQSSRQFIFEAHSEAITPLITEKLHVNHTQKKQAILFLPTRANFKYLICEACGFTYECPYCSVGMSLHKNSRYVKCHYCNFTETIPQICPKCRSKSLVHSRLGTAEAMTVLNEKLPEIKTAQFDRDTITTQKKLTNLLKDFNSGEIDMLIGTQMLSKGHDYHNISLAVILGLDNILNLSDYRAHERALSLLLQISGRSGRKSDALVLVQSFHESFFKKYLTNYEDFLEDEKKFRENLYPPFKKLARLMFAHKKIDKAQEAMSEVLQTIRSHNRVEIVGFGPSPIEKIASKFRFQILLRSDKATDLIKVIKASKNKLCEVDMDPLEFS